MKRFCLFFICASLAVGLFAERSVQDVLKTFDEALMKNGVGEAGAVIGKITYADTDVCGSVVPFFRGEIEKAADNTRRIKIVPSSNADDGAKIVAATRSLGAGMLMPKKNAAKKNYVIDGRYNEKDGGVELVLTLLDQDAKTVKSAGVFFAKDKVQGYTLYPSNIKTQKLVDEDFAAAAQNTSNEKLKISACMLDEQGNQAEILRPGDIVKFVIQTSADAYIALQGIDATGDVYWLPIEDNFIPAGKKRVFPDIEGTEFKVMDGIYGAESIIIHAFSTNEALQSQVSFLEGKYRKGMIGNTRGIGAFKSNSAGTGAKDSANGMFKIVYTVVE